MSRRAIKAGARHRALAPCRFRGAVSAQDTTGRAPTGSIESIDPHASQIPARRASLFQLFFNLISTLNQGTPSPLLLCLLRSSLSFVRWRRRPIHPAAGRIAPDQTRPETPSSCYPVNYTIACSLPGMGLQGRGSREKYWRVISFAFSALQK